MEKTKNFKSDYIKFGIVLLFMFGFRFLPPIGSITPYGMAVLGIMIGAILGWSFDGASMLQTSLIALVALALAGYTGGINGVATNLLASSNLTVMILCMIMTGALMDAGVDNWLIAKLMNLPFAKGKPWVITFLFVFVPFVLCIFIMNTSLMLFLLPLYAKLFRGAGYQNGDKYVIHVFLGSVLSAMAAVYLFPFIGVALVFGGLVQAYTGVMWTQAEYMMTISVFSILLSAGYVLFMRLIGCDASKMKDVDLSVFGDANAGITKHQKGVLACIILYIIGSIIISFGSLIDSPITNLLAQVGIYGWIFTIIAIMMIVRVDGKRLMNVHTATAKGLSMDLIMLVAAATLVGGALTSAESGFSAFLTSLAAPLLGGLGPYAFAAVLFIAALVATNFCNNMAIMFIGFALIGSFVAGGMNINGPMLAGGVMLFSQLGFMLPSSSMWGAILHTAEMATPSSVIKNSFLMMLYIIVMTLVIFIPLCMVVFY